MFSSNKEVYWTNHIKGKIKQYGLSQQRIRRVLKSPNRKEVGIAPNTVAVMQATGSKKYPTEIWVMFQSINSKNKNSINMISAWRYPGISPKGRFPEIPEDAILELEKFKNL